MNGGVWKSLGLLLAAIAHFVENEKNSEVGRANLAAVVLLIILMPTLLFPQATVQVARLILNRPAPEWNFALPIIAIGIVAGVLVLSLFMIPREPPA